MNRAIYIFGAGIKGNEILDKLIGWGKEKNIAAFIDNSEDKQKAGVRGFECLSIKTAIDRGARDAMVLVSPVEHKEIVNELEENNFKHVFCVSKWLRKDKYYKPIVMEELDFENAVPFNHYESPYVDIVKIHEKEEELFDKDRAILDIDFNVDRQLGLLEEMKELELPGWTDGKDSMNRYRYHYHNGWFMKGSADALYYMMRLIKPKRMIEIGSGYSTAVMLDVNEAYFDSKVQITSIEPRAERLRSLLRPNDHLEIIEKDIQDIPIHFFEQLDENDILFIDSSHIAKMDSDVNYLFFEIFPCLKKGVYIHLHDIMYPFVYPKKWIYEGRAYNEMYILRAFLMNNKKYSIQFFGDMLSKKYESFIGEMRGCGENSFWMRKDGIEVR